MANTTIEYLKHGKALCGKVFASFVETFNWHTDFCSNLMGDADLPGKAGGTGRIKVDRTDPSHPIIRLESPYSTNGEEPKEPEEPEEEPDEPYDPPYDDPDDPDDPGEEDPYEGDEDYDPDDDQDPWYEDPEDSPASPEGGSGCNFWSDEPHFGGGLAGGGGWSGDNCGSINNFNR